MYWEVLCTLCPVFPSDDTLCYTLHVKMRTLTWMQPTELTQISQTSCAVCVCACVPMWLHHM